MRSKTIYVFSILPHLVFVLILSILISNDKHPLLLILMALYTLFILRTYKFTFILFIAVLGLYFALYDAKINTLIQTPPKETETCEINSLPEKEIQGGVVEQSFYCRKGDVSLLIRYEGEEDMELSIGDYVVVSGKSRTAEPNSVPQLFNYKRYLQSKNVYYILDAKELEVVQSTNKIHYMLMNKATDIYDGPLKDYQLSLLIGEQNLFEERFEDNVSSLGISHLFVVSGFHVTSLALMIKGILRPLHVTKEKARGVVNVILFFYLMINNFQPSILRSVALYYGIEVKDHFRLPIETGQILAGIFLTSVLFQPLIVYHVGFQLSYLVTFILILSQKILSKYSQNKIFSIIYTTFVAQLSSLPIVGNFSFEYNALSLLLSPFLLLYFNGVIFPLTIISLVLDPLSQVFLPLYELYEKLITLFSKLTFLTVNIGAFDLTRTILFYLVFFFFMQGRERARPQKLLGLFLILLVFTYHRFTLISTVAYIDVGQGDSAYVETPFKTCSMLIDTGGTIFPGSTFHPGERHVLPYLKSKQVTSLDYLLVSHGDRDHIGDYRFILDAIDVQTILFSVFDQSELKTEIMTYGKEKGITIKELRKGDHVTCGPLQINVHSPKEAYDDTNDQSLVISFRMKEDLYLFTGDISSKIEEEINQSLPQDIAFLKVSHHGSKTSTSEGFLEKVNPEVAIISVGKNNSYRHPSNDVLKRLGDNNITFYTTSDHGTIIVKYYMDVRVIKKTKK